MATYVLDPAARTSVLPWSREYQGFKHSTKGNGFLAGEPPPGGTMTSDGIPLSATVRILLRTAEGEPGDGTLVSTVVSNPDGSWFVGNLNPDFRYDAVGRKAGYADVIVSNLRPMRSDLMEVVRNSLASNDTSTGLDGLVEFVGGHPPYDFSIDGVYPSGLTPVFDRRRLSFSGTTSEIGEWDFDVTFTASNGVSVTQPISVTILPPIIINGGVWGAANLETYHGGFTAENLGSSAQWSIVSGKLPKGLHLDPATGQITGVCNDTPGYYEVGVRVSSAGRSAEKVFEIPVAAYSYLLHFTGAQGDTTFTDAAGFNWTRSGAAAIVTTAQKVSDELGSVFQTSGGSFISRGAEAANDLSVDDFYIEVWARKVGSDTFASLFGKRSSGAAVDWMLRHYNSNDVPFFYIQTTTNDAKSITGTVVPKNTWYHFAVARRGQKLRGWLNGVYLGEITFTGNLRNSATLVFGDSPLGYSDDNFNGQMDEFKMVKKAAMRWEAENFTPSTVPYDFPQPAPALAVNGSLPNAAVGVAYDNSTGVTIYGTGPFTASVVSGATPQGWNVSVVGDKIRVAGLAGPAATASFTVKVVDTALREVLIPLTVKIV